MMLWTIERVEQLSSHPENIGNREIVPIEDAHPRVNFFARPRGWRPV